MRPVRQASKTIVLGLLLATAFLASGCAGAESQADPSTSAPVGSVSFTPEPEAETGTIQGAVTDEEVKPISGAEVSILELNLKVTTGDAGTFEFKDVPVGKYKVGAGRIGYDSAFKAVELVAANETVEVQFILAALVIQETYHFTLTFAGKMSCGIALVPVCGVTDELNQDYGTPNPTEERWLFNWTFPDPVAPVESIMELVWTPTIGGTAQELTILALSGFSGQATGGSPVRMIIDGEEYKDNLKSNPQYKFQFGIYPELADPVIDQRFTVYLTHFYGEAPPEGWSYLDQPG